MAEARTEPLDIHEQKIAIDSALERAGKELDALEKKREKLLSGSPPRHKRIRIEEDVEKADREYRSLMDQAEGIKEAVKRYSDAVDKGKASYVHYKMGDPKASFRITNRWTTGATGWPFDRLYKGKQILLCDDPLALAFFEDHRSEIIHGGNRRASTNTFEVFVTPEDQVELDKFREMSAARGKEQQQMYREIFG